MEANEQAEEIARLKTALAAALSDKELAMQERDAYRDAYEEMKTAAYAWRTRAETAKSKP
jgi:hypothetical protein